MIYSTPKSYCKYEAPSQTRDPGPTSKKEQLHSEAAESIATPLQQQIPEASKTLRPEREKGSPQAPKVSNSRGSNLQAFGKRGLEFRVGEAVSHD